MSLDQEKGESEKDVLALAKKRVGVQLGTGGDRG